jgi:hypothetical protein
MKDGPFSGWESCYVARRASGEGKRESVTRIEGGRGWASPRCTVREMDSGNARVFGDGGGLIFDVSWSILRCKGIDGAYCGGVQWTPLNYHLIRGCNCSSPGT